ncbi:hypothetical protein F2Q68_00040313 [Brassica cretica]|uniref:Uncharacterized protein n=1 Tax=Brassica cretica TaxID=69181 RepID=A0A8S9MMD9_BRACR|nr:hypothetical protein F2Q68_00040313 [Brassica cretica]
MLVAQDQDSNEVLDAKGIQLAYRHLETIQHTDDNFRNREPQATAHYECFVTSKVVLRGTACALSSTKNPELHRIRNLIERPHDLEEFASTAPSSSGRRFMTGNDFSFGGVIEL